MTKATGWKAVAEYYGLHTQLIKLCEEIGELIVADKMFSEGFIDHSEVVTEIADVYALSEQVDYLLGDCTGELEDLVERELERFDPPYTYIPYTASVIVVAAKMANYDLDRSILLQPLAVLLAHLRKYCTVADCEQEVRREKARKLKRQQERMRKEQKTKNDNE